MAQKTQNPFTQVKGGRGSPKDLKLNGSYYVVDPCYVFGSLTKEDHRDIIQEMWGWDDYKDGNGHDWVTFEYRGKTIFMFGTSFGDGSYPVLIDSFTVGFAGVDSGKLAFIPLDAVEDIEYIGVEVKVNGTVSLDKGDVTVGNVTVMTSESSDD